MNGTPQVIVAGGWRARESQCFWDKGVLLLQVETFVRKVFHKQTLSKETTRAARDVQSPSSRKLIMDILR